MTQQHPTSSFHPVITKSEPFRDEERRSMGEYDRRTKSTAFDRRDMQIQPYTGPPAREFNTDANKGKSGSSSSKNWSFSDPEFQRKKRVASYKVYAVEGKVKGSFRKSFRWLKDKYTKVVYGWW